MTDQVPNEKQVPWLHRPLGIAVRLVVGAIAFVAGAGIVFLAALVGHCAAFGGSCPRATTFDWEVFSTAAAGGALAGGVPFFVWQPSRRRLLHAVVAAAIIGVVVGALVSDATAG